MIVTDLFQSGAENGMFRYPARNTCDLVAPICRFLYDDTHCNMGTRDGTFTQLLKDVRIAVKIKFVSHWEINECPVNSGQSAYCTIGCRIFPCKVWLCDFKDMWEKERKRALFLASPSVKVWFHTLSIPSSGSQTLKSPAITPSAPG